MSMAESEKLYVPLPRVEAPSGSFEETKSTGSCMLGGCMLNVVQAMEWEDPHATRFT